jgi:hypothetical protein
MPFNQSCRRKKKPPKRPWHKKPCPPPHPNPCPPPKPAPTPPRSERPAPQVGRGRCWTCAFWEGPLVGRPNVGTCEATVMLKDGTHPFERSQAKVELDAGRHCKEGRYILVTMKQFGCAQWRKG